MHTESQPSNDIPPIHELVGKHDAVSVANKLLQLPNETRILLDGALNMHRLSVEQCLDADFLAGLAPEDLVEISSDLSDLRYNTDPLSQKEIVETIASRLDY